MNHVHLQLNINQYMAASKINEDVLAALHQGADTIVLNEVTETAAKALRTFGSGRGYAAFRGHGSASQIVVLWRDDRYELVDATQRQATDGVTGISPDRFVLVVRLREKATGLIVAVMGTHMISEAWTHKDETTAYRRRTWRKHYKLMRQLVRSTRADILVGSGDLNRPRGTFPRPNTPLALLIPRNRGGIVKTGNTHGSVVFDYVWFSSAKRRMSVIRQHTIRFHSDHRGVLVTLYY